MAILHLQDLVGCFDKELGKFHLPFIKIKKGT